jgi:hypothetical protein
VSTRPAPRLPFPASGRVVKACLLLGAELKLSWLEHVALDRSEGAYIGASHMAQRLGVSRDSIERGRRELTRLGLLILGTRGPGQTGTYYPALPTRCIPSGRPAVAEIARLAERLDEHIRRIRSGGVLAASLTTPPGGANAARLAALVVPESTTSAAALAALAPPPSDRERAQTGGTGAAAKSSREEVGRSTTQTSPPPYTSEGGEPQTSHHPEGGGSVFDREKAEEQQPQEAASQAARKGETDPVPVGQVLGPFVELLPPEVRAEFLRYKKSRKRAAPPAEGGTP